MDALFEGAIVVTQLVGVDDFSLGMRTPTRQQQALDQQRIGMGSLR